MRGSTGSRFRNYVFILLCIALPCSVVGLFWPVIGISGCHGDAYRTGNYLAYCESTGYGDYEHAALFFNLEPEAIRNLRAADILLVGNSRAQVAFSTAAAKDFAADRGWRFYRMGFGYYEQSAFPKTLFQRYHLRPRVVIINADPFFTDLSSTASQRLVSGTDEITDYVQSIIKQFAQTIQRATCAARKLTRLTCGDARTIFRDRTDGVWDVTYYRIPRTLPVIFDPSNLMQAAPATIEIARDFIAATGLDPKCVLLTVVPSDSATPLLAQAVASAQGTPLIAPTLQGLSTFDHSHLDEPSAERWSKQFLREAEPSITACLGSSPAADHQSTASPAASPP